MTGSAHHENDLGSEITVDSGDIPAATGWTITEGTVNRVGPEVFVHVEVENGAGAPALVMTLPQDYWPDNPVHTENGLFVIRDAVGVNAVHHIATTGVPTGGSSTVTYPGKAPITLPWNASVVAVQALYDGIFGAGNTLVAGTALPAGSMSVTFQGALAHTVMALPTVNNAGLTGGTSPAAAVTSTTAGAIPGGIIYTGDTTGAASTPIICEAVYDPYKHG